MDPRAHTHTDASPLHDQARSQCGQLGLMTALPKSTYLTCHHGQLGWSVVLSLDLLHMICLLFPLSHCKRILEYTSSNATHPSFCPFSSLWMLLISLSADASAVRIANTARVIIANECSVMLLWMCRAAPGRSVKRGSGGSSMKYPEFPLDFWFSGGSTYSIFWWSRIGSFLSLISILIFDAEHVYFKLWVTKFKIKEVHHTLNLIW